LLDFAGVGTLEAFNTDGLRTLLRTIDAPFMKEKTLRYPGHVQLMRALRETGFFSKIPVEVAGQLVRPLDLTAAILFPKWTFEEGEADLTVLRVMVEGRRGSSRERYSWDLLDYFDPQSGLRSMSRTTAFPAAIVASLVASGGFERPGVHAPETLGATPGLLEVILHELRARGVEWGGSVMAEEAEPALVGGRGR
jgi:saccharopine dehydrogenase-like NADP-dependent oxidoreductase